MIDCPHCDRAFEKRSGLMRHVTTTHKDLVDDPGSTTDLLNASDGIERDDWDERGPLDDEPVKPGDVSQDQPSYATMTVGGVEMRPGDVVHIDMDAGTVAVGPDAREIDSLAGVTLLGDSVQGLYETPVRLAWPDPDAEQRRTANGGAGHGHRPPSYLTRRG